MKNEEQVVIVYIVQLNGSYNFGGDLSYLFQLLVYLLENGDNDKGFIGITFFRKLL